METVGQSNRIRAIVGWIGLTLGIGLLAFWLAGSLLSPLELAASDVLFRLRGAIEPESPVLVVAIDDASFTQNGLQWPWPRDYIARVVDGVASGHPAVIAVDVFFYEASDQEEDAELARAIADAGNVVLVNDISVQTQGGADIRTLNRPIPELDEAVATLGLTNFPRDNDGTVRRLLAFQSHNDQLLFSWALQVSRLYLGEQEFEVLSGDEILIGDHSVALQSQYLRVNYLGGAGTVRTYSAYQVVEGLVDPSVFEGKIVLIGATSESLHDSYPTPFGSSPPMPGVEINAHAIDTILSGRTITPVNGLFSAVIAVLTALIGIGLAVRLRPVVALLVVAGVVILYGVGSAVLFNAGRIMMPIVGPVVAIVVTYITGTAIQLYDEQRKRAKVRGLFERYVAPAAIEQMLNQSDSYMLTGQRRELTILFSDIRGFTTMSENLTPDEVVSILDQYLSAMTELIFKYKGTIDKFEGDAILAVWNAPLDVPDHAAQAVACAMEMIKELAQLQQMWSDKGEAALRIGVGINTGQAFVGNIGSALRMDYTVIGDAVNLASRLQDLTKEAGVPILFSEATRDQLTPGFKTRFVTTAQVKGRVQSVNVYTVEEA